MIDNQYSFPKRNLFPVVMTIVVHFMDVNGYLHVDYICLKSLTTQMSPDWNNSKQTLKKYNLKEFLLNCLMGERNGEILIYLALIRAGYVPIRLSQLGILHLYCNIIALK